MAIFCALSFLIKVDIKMWKIFKAAINTQIKKGRISRDYDIKEILT